jgi:hypothetical protein
MRNRFVHRRRKIDKKIGGQIGGPVGRRIA